MAAPRTAIVVGGGPAGLAAACRLSEGGLATTLLEAKAGLGGRAASEHREGFDLNQGPHALYAGGPALRELRAMGIDPPLWNPLSPPGSVLVRGGNVTRRPGGSVGLLRWLAGVSRCRPEELSHLSAAEWLRQEILSEPARAMAAAIVRVTTFVADDEALSADVAATQVKLGLFPGVRYVKGGWQWLVDALADEAEGHGAILRTRAGVRSVRRAEDGWQLTLDEELLRADILVVAAGLPDAFAGLLESRAPSPPGPAAELSVLDLGLKKMPRRRTFALGIDSPTYLSRHSPPRHRGGVLLSLASYAREPRANLEEMAEAVQPGWREQAILQRFLPRMVAVSALPSPESGGLAGRPAVARGEGLFLAGDWLGPQGWLVDAAISSGVAAASAALSEAGRPAAMAA